MASHGTGGRLGMTAWDGLIRPEKQRSVPKWIAVVVAVLVVAFGVAAAGFLLTVRQVEDSSVPENH